MVNVLLKFRNNSKDPGSVIAFHDKKVCFITKDSDVKPAHGECWECFMWVEREKYNLVKPFRKIDPEQYETEKLRVDEFNKELAKLNSILKKGDFDKIVFSENNKPYLLSTKPLDYLKGKYGDHIILKKQNGEKWVRPILSPEDRKEFQRNCI